MKEHFVKTATDIGVGPGAYQTTRSLDRSIPNPTIPRQKYKARTFTKFKKTGKFKNSGSIRDDFSSGSEEEETDQKRSPYIDK